jgi:hypothetical protein
MSLLHHPAMAPDVPLGLLQLHGRWRAFRPVSGVGFDGRPHRSQKRA